MGHGRDSRARRCRRKASRSPPSTASTTSRSSSAARVIGGRSIRARSVTSPLVRIRIRRAAGIRMSRAGSRHHDRGSTGSHRRTEVRPRRPEGPAGSVVDPSPPSSSPESLPESSSESRLRRGGRCVVGLVLVADSSSTSSSAVVARAGRRRWRPRGSPEPLVARSVPPLSPLPGGRSWCHAWPRLRLVGRRRLLGLLLVGRRGLLRLGLVGSDPRSRPRRPRWAPRSRPRPSRARRSPIPARPATVGRGVAAADERRSSRRRRPRSGTARRARSRSTEHAVGVLHRQVDSAVGLRALPDGPRSLCPRRAAAKRFQPERTARRPRQAGSSAPPDGPPRAPGRVSPAASSDRP